MAVRKRAMRTRALQEVVQRMEQKAATKALLKRARDVFDQNQQLLLKQQQEFMQLLETGGIERIASASEISEPASAYEDLLSVFKPKKNKTSQDQVSIDFFPPSQQTAKDDAAEDMVLGLSQLAVDPKVEK